MEEPGEVARALEQHRSRLVALAYRMLGSVASAEDVVQETWLRARRASGIVDPGAWLTTVCTRLCLDELRSARVRRERYVGEWLPEPCPSPPPEPGILGESLTTAFLLLLQRLSARERAAWLLREVFDEDYAHIASVLDSTEPAVRQLVRRARAAIRAGRPRYEPDPARHAEMIAAFGAACASGDVRALEAMLAADVQLIGDGGGVRPSAMRPILGPDRVARFLIGIWRKLPGGIRIEPASLNGQPGVLLWTEDGVLYGASSVAIAGGLVHHIFNVMNPHKLHHLQVLRPRELEAGTAPASAASPGPGPDRLRGPGSPPGSGGGR